MLSQEDNFLLNPFSTLIEEKNTTCQVELNNVDDRASAKERQNPNEAIVAETPPTLETFIDNIDVDVTDSLQLEKIYPLKTISNVYSNSKKPILIFK